MRGELLVRIFSSAQDDVAQAECGRKRAAVWAGDLDARTQLSRSSHVSFRTVRWERPVGPLRRNRRLSSRVTCQLDHHYLNEEVISLKDRPITTESLARYIYE